MPDHTLCIAPMLDWTDRYCRYFLRLISRHTRLYTEMITTGALLHGDPGRWLSFDPAEHPVALQLGGSDPPDLARCARLGQQWGYDEINLNVGCPSDRVRSGRFGACLMATPNVVAECVAAMRDAVTTEVSVKHRIGIDDQDSYQELCDFVGTVAEIGCRIFVVHARKAWLQGLSPKENREVPPLRYDWVHQLKRDFPQLEIVLNGGVRTLEAVRDQLSLVDGVMIGREAYHNPWILAEADRWLFDDPHPVPSRHQVLERLLPFVQREVEHGTPVSRITRHLMGLFNGMPGARAWRRHLSEHACRTGARPEVILQAAAKVPETI